MSGASAELRVSPAAPASSRWNRRRRCSQLAFATFFLVLPLSYRFGQDQVLGSLAALKLGPISLIDPAVAISTALAARGADTALWTGLAVPVALALILGPVFCSWVCPWGLVSEGIDRLRRNRVRPIPRWLRSLRWSTLALCFLLSLALGLPLVTLVSAPRLITVLPMEVLFLGGASIGTLSLLAALFALEWILPRRLWCRALCPVGSTLVLLRTPWTLIVGWQQATCKTGGCGVRCFVSCPWNLDPRRMRRFDGCTNCGVCIDGCPPEPTSALAFAWGELGERADEDAGLIEREPAVRR